MLTDLAHFLGLPIARNMEAGLQCERAQSTAWAHLARDRCNLRLTKDELVEVNRERLHRRVTDRLAEFSDRRKAK